MAEPCCLPAPQPATDRTASICPGCGGRGRPVELTTIQAQVAISLRELARDGYHFCAAPGCAVVYFTAAAPPITHEQLRERVFQKEPGGDVFICYCFRYSVEMIQRSSSAQRAAILNDVVEGTRHGQCACEIRNPQGACCLANLRRLLRMSEQ